MLSSLLRSIRGIKSQRQLDMAAAKYLASVKALPPDQQGWSARTILESKEAFTSWFENFSECTKEISEAETVEKQLLVTRKKCMDALQSSQFSRIFLDEERSHDEKVAVAEVILGRSFDEQLVREQLLLYAHSDLSMRCLRFISATEFDDFRSDDWFAFYSDLHTLLMNSVVKDVVGKRNGESQWELIMRGHKSLVDEARAKILKGENWNYTEADRAKLGVGDG